MAPTWKAFGGKHVWASFLSCKCCLCILSRRHAGGVWQVVSGASRTPAGFSVRAAHEHKKRLSKLAYVFALPWFLIKEGSYRKCELCGSDPGGIVLLYRTRPYLSHAHCDREPVSLACWRIFFTSGTSRFTPQRVSFPRWAMRFVAA